MLRMLINPRYLLPMMIFVGVMIMGLRLGDVWDAAATGKLFSPAHAQSAAPASSSSSSSAAAASSPSSGPNITPPTLGADTSKPAADASPAPTASSAPPDDEDVSPAEMEVLKQLSGRREALDKRSRDLDTREALIKVAEQRVDQKIKEMETLRLQLQSMVNQVSETQATQIENLVKIYETMKPDDAAKIFDNLDMSVLLNVIQRMKPARTAPILAAMSSEKAKDVTTALTKQDQLPQIK